MNIIDEIFRLTPKPIYLRGLEINEERNIIIRGRASSMSEIFNYVTTLEESDKITSVKTNFTTSKGDKEGSYAEFEISCNMMRSED